MLPEMPAAPAVRAELDLLWEHIRVLEDQVGAAQSARGALSPGAGREGGCL